MNRTNTYLATCLIFTIGTGHMTANADTNPHGEDVYPVIAVEGEDDGPRHPAGLLQQTPTSPSSLSASLVEGETGPTEDRGVLSEPAPSAQPDEPVMTYMHTASSAMHKSGISTDRGRWRGWCEGWWVGENLTPARWAANPERGRRMMRRLIACVFARLAPGESGVALYVATRESSLYPFAWNQSSDCRGLFQHRGPYWSERARSYLWRGWFAPWHWPVSAFDPRANAIVSARMVAAGGWGPWTTAP